MSLPDGTIENPQISQPQSLFHAPTALSLAARAAGHGTGTPSGPMNIIPMGSQWIEMISAVFQWGIVNKCGFYYGFTMVLLWLILWFNG